MNKRTATELGILLMVAISGIIIVPRAVGIGDWLHSLWYQPPAIVEQIARDSGRSPAGKRLWYRYQPQLVPLQKLGQTCPFEDAVLGCITNDGIFLAEFNSAAEYQRTLVTAAHEMLHVAYERLGHSQRARIGQWLEQAIPGLPRRIQQQINDYQDPDIRLSEAHSIIGSQVANLPPRLEQYYEQYFTDRQKTVDAYLASPESGIF